MFLNIDSYYIDYYTIKITCANPDYHAVAEFKEYTMMIFKKKDEVRKYKKITGSNEAKQLFKLYLTKELKK